MQDNVTDTLTDPASRSKQSDALIADFITEDMLADAISDDGVQESCEGIEYDASGGAGVCMHMMHLIPHF